MADSCYGERFTFGTFQEAQLIRENADFLIDKQGYLTIRDLLKLIFHTEVMWDTWGNGNDEDFLDSYGWLDTLGWKVKETGYYWVLDTTDPVEINELGVK